MANNDPHIILFEAYLNQRLSIEQSADFETRLQEDADFKAQFIRYKQLAHLVEAVVEDDAFAEREKKLHALSGEIDAALDESVPPKEAKIKSLRWQVLVPIVAAVLLLLFIVFWPRENKTNCDPHSLYTTYAQEWSSFHFRTMLSAGNNTSHQPRLAAAEAYTMQEYERSLEILDAYLADTLDSEASLLQALCFLQLRQYEDCLASIATISPDSENYEEAVWIKTLASLQQEDYLQLRRTLEQLVLEQNPHQAEAEIIKEKLNCLSPTPEP